jgi:hypothetical protein
MARTTSVAAAVSLCLVFSGCYGLYEGKAEKNLKTAQQWKADEFDESKQTYEQAAKALEAARAAKSGGNGGEAKTQAKSAADLSKTAMEQAMTRFADVQLKEAEAAMKVAVINEANRGETQQQYTEAEEILADAREKYNNQKYEKSIEQSNDVMARVNRMLAGVQNKAERDLANLKTSVDELIKAEGETYTASDVDRAREAVKQITEKVEKDRDYKQASLLAESARGEAQSATIESKRKHSEAELLALEDKIAEAIAEEAPVHVPDQLQKVQLRYEALLATFRDKQYDTVLSAASNLRPQVDELITMARIEATKDRMRRVDEAIAKLKSQNVEQYLPGRVSRMEELQARAHQEFDNNNYEGAKLEANNALLEHDRISASFDALAEKHLQTASAAVGSTKEAYERMKQVFGSNATPVDPRIESRYQVQAADLGTNLNAAIQLLSSASENRTAKEFRKAIEQSDQAAAQASQIANGTYKLVAENALLGIQDQISELERHGASEFASQSLADVRQMVGQSQAQLRSNQSREAAESAARARAALENVKQEIAQRAAGEAREADRLIQRIEGGAGPAPAAGGMRYMGRPQRQMPFGEYPGGAALDNKEAILADAAEAASALPAEDMTMLAQTSTGHPVNSTGWTGSPAVIQNRSLPNGTFATSGRPSNVFLGTGAPTGAAIGQRAEPVVNTYEATGAYRSSSTGSYEAPTAPGPFVAAGDPTAIDPNAPVGLVPAAAEITGARQQIDELVNDAQRIKDLEDFEPTAVEAARQKLNESSSALAAQDYTRAVQLAREAQRTLFEADRNAAKQAASRDLQAAADRVNLANAAGAAMFAPAQLTESRRLFDQGTAFMKSGDYREARKVAARALIAAEDARSYNVDKAKDLASLSVRYGGYKASAPVLTEANRLADIADDMMRNPASAAEGQEVAKQAVTMAQIALDHARDYTYQERLDNIYKALNQALRAGANYFNVVEIKRLIAELAVARDQYCTRNFDAVELKLKDIEARLARVIETTPLVLEENLVETTEKLNALILAGAENWMSQQVDDVKSLMNRSVIDFRKHDYQSSYMNIRNAMALTDRIEQRLQEQVYFDAVTELFAQLDDTFHKFEPVINHGPAFMKKLVSTQWGQPRAMDLSSRLNPNEFKDKINDIYMRAIHLKPPKSQEAIHTQVLIAIKHAKVASENFQKLYILDQVSMPDAYDIIDTAYAQIKQAQTLRGEVQVKLIEPQARMKVIRAEKIVNY